MTRSSLLLTLALSLSLAACGPGPGTHARVKFQDVTRPVASPSLFEMPLRSIALVGESVRDTVWESGGGGEPVDFTASVNEQIDAHARSLELGTYSHVEVRLCDEGTATVRWQAVGIPAPRSFETSCVKTSALGDALVVGGGEQVVVKLSYDASVSRRAAATGDDCVGTLDDLVCFSVPAFVPTLSVETVVE